MSKTVESGLKRNRRIVRDRPEFRYFWNQWEAEQGSSDRSMDTTHGLSQGFSTWRFSGAGRPDRKAILSNSRSKDTTASCFTMPFFIDKEAQRVATIQKIGEGFAVWRKIPVAAPASPHRDYDRREEGPWKGNARLGHCRALSDRPRPARDSALLSSH